jgi:ABC-2 type transport system permease protein
MIRLRALLLKEFIQMRRDRLTFGLMIGIPIFQLLMFGFAINTDVKHLPTVVFDQSHSAESRDLLESFSASGYFDLDIFVNSFKEVNSLIDNGRAKVGIILPPDFAEEVRSGRSASVQVIVDASDSMAASSAISTAMTIGQLRSQNIMIKRLESLGGRISGLPYDIRIRPWYNPDFVTAFYMVPGIMGMILTMTMVMITSMAIVREREHGTLEQLIVTPMKSWELMLGKIIPYVFVGLVQAGVALMVGILVFDLPIRGNLIELFLYTLLFIVASLSLGILISNFSQTQMQAMQLSFFIFLPSVLLSGFMFPREAMPEFFFQLGKLLPLTFYLQIMRGVVLKGVGIVALWPQVTALLVYTSIVLTISVVKFRKKLA